MINRIRETVHRTYNIIYFLNEININITNMLRRNNYD